MLTITLFIIENNNVVEDCIKCITLLKRTEPQCVHKIIKNINKSIILMYYIIWFDGFSNDHAINRLSVYIRLYSTHNIRYYYITVIIII